MLNSITLAVVIKVLILLNACLSIFGQCPPEDDILPCKCFDGGHTNLVCTGLQEDEVLRKVFLNSANYKYVQVHIKFSTLKYLPHELFAHTEVQELYLENSTLHSLFDTPPDELKNLYKLHLENTNIVKLSNWNLFKPLKNLKFLSIYYNVIQTLDSSLDKYVTTDLRSLALYGTGTSKIEQGALTEFINLDRLSIDACKLTVLFRDLFPKPFNVKHLYFLENEIEVIPADMFTGMPNLQTVGLRKNFLTTVPESAFEGKSGKISYIMLDDNPLKCDCKLKWLTKSKPEVLTGTCATPIRLHDKKLSDLTDTDFKC